MYLYWDEKTITDFSPKNIEEMYNRGYVFTRKGKGVMQQTRSVRIDLEKFQPSSENRRILKKSEGLSFEKHSLPYPNYDWSIGKTAKDFYTARDAEFSANKIKELVTDSKKSNFNSLIIYSGLTTVNDPVGYVIGFETENIFHYSYPFYSGPSKDMGLGMMLMAIFWAKSEGKKYFYIGSLQRPSDSYKLQFAGIEWSNGKEWQTDLEKAKEILQ